MDKLKAVKCKRLGNIISFSNDCWNQKDYFDESFPYIEISEIDIDTGYINKISMVKKEEAPSRAKMIVRENDIILSTTRPNRGAIAFISQNENLSIASTGFAVLRNIICSDLERRYLFFVLRTDLILKQLEMHQSGGSYPAVTIKDIHKILIPIPLIEIQQQIIEIMDNAYLIKQQKEKQASELLGSSNDYLLGMLGIVMPEIEENTLENRMSYLSSSDVIGGRFDPNYYTGQEEFLSAIKKSKYDIVVFGKIMTDLNNGVEIRDYSKDGFRYLRVTDMSNRGIVNNSPRYVNVGEIPAKIVLSSNDLLISRSGSLGLVNIVESEIKNSILSSHIFKVSIAEKVCTEYLQEYLRSDIGQFQFFKKNNGGIIPEISQTALRLILIVLPPSDKQREISLHIKSIRGKAKQLEEEAITVLNNAKGQVEKILLGKI